ATEEERGHASREDPEGHRDARPVARQSELLMQEKRPEVAEDVEHGAAEGERQKPKSDVAQDIEVIPRRGDGLRRGRGPTAGEEETDRDGEQVQAAPQDER